MKASKFTKTQIACIPKQVEHGAKVAEIYQKSGTTSVKVQAQYEK